MLTGVWLAAIAATARASSNEPGQSVPAPADAPPIGSSAAVAEPVAPATSATYRIGLDDALSIAVLQAPELNVAVRVSGQGEISMPLLGTVRAAELTAQELELELERRLREKYIRSPDVTVQVTEIRSRGVLVVGAVRKPGILQIPGPKTLLEVLTLAGGLADDAGDAVIVVRNGVAARTAAPGDARDVAPTGAPEERLDDVEAVEGNALEVRIQALMSADDARANVTVHPGDAVSVQSAALVYVIGAIKKPGAFSVRGNGGLTVLRALALGEGLTPLAAKGDAVVLRSNDRGERVEIPVDLGGILKGTDPDIALEGQDVLFVPNSGGKAVALGTLTALARVTLRTVTLW